MRSFNINQCSAVFAGTEKIDGRTGSVFHHAAPGKDDAVLKVEFKDNLARLSVPTYNVDGAGAPTLLTLTWVPISNWLWCDVEPREIAAAGQRGDLLEANRILRDIMKFADDDAEERPMTYYLKGLLQAIADFSKTKFTVNVEVDRAELLRWKGFTPDWTIDVVKAALEAYKPRGGSLAYDHDGLMCLRVLSFDFTPGTPSELGRTTIRRFLDEIEVLLSDMEKNTVRAAVDSVAVPEVEEAAI